MTVVVLAGSLRTMDASKLGIHLRKMAHRVVAPPAGDAPRSRRPRGPCLMAQWLP